MRNSVWLGGGYMAVGFLFLSYFTCHAISRLSLENREIAREKTRETGLKSLPLIIFGLPDLDINNILGAGAVGHPRLVWGAVQSDEGGDEILRKPRKNSIHKPKTAIGQIRIHPYG